MITFQIMQDARLRLALHLKPTPTSYAWALSEKFSRPVWFKHETQNPTGSFKVRPAFNSILSQLETARRQGIVTSSSGNFAQGVAYAAQALACDAMIVMTENTSPYKIAKTRELGAKVVLCENSFVARWQLTEKLAKESGRLFVHPYDSEETIAGDSTIGFELAEQCEEKSLTVLVPVSGGGLIAGIASALKILKPEWRIIGVQPKVAGAMAKSLAAGCPIDVGRFTTVADALVAAKPGNLTFQIASKLVDDMILVDEDEISYAVEFLEREQKLVVEPGGAVGVAALLGKKLRADPSAVACILSGANRAL